MFLIWCHSCRKNIPLCWLPVLLILLSNDVHFKPWTTFSWNLNTLAKDNFARVRLLEAHNTLYNYDLISVCETNLNNSVELAETLLNDYTCMPANNPANTRSGGVGLFFKNSPVLVCNDQSFDASVVVELKFDRKKIFFTVLYRCPAFNHHHSRISSLFVKFLKSAFKTPS